MISEAYINRTVKEIFEEIEFPAAPAGLYDPLRYMISIGGKRILPKLCILTYSIFKDDLYNEIIEPALALEVFHSFTLIHDDIMDRSPLRRGMPTVWKKWSEDTAILSGDQMLIEAYKLLSGVPDDKLPQVLKWFNEMATGICEGQELDVDFEHMSHVSIEDYMHMIELKTSVLLANAMRIGGYIAGATPVQQEALYQYGLHIGLAFQIQDDILDVTGDEAKLGKPVLSDEKNEKDTKNHIRITDSRDDPRFIIRLRGR